MRFRNPLGRGVVAVPPRFDEQPVLLKEAGVVDGDPTDGGLSVDHRAIEGSPAAQWMAALAEPLRLVPRADR